MQLRTNDGMSNGGGASGGAASESGGGSRARDEELRLECAKVFGYYKEGNVKLQGTKVLERLFRQHPSHPLPHYTYVRISHKMALEPPRQEESLRKLFRKCHERAAAALNACPDSLVIRLLFAEVCFDNPFLTDEQRSSLGASCAPPQVTAECASADLRLMATIASFDEEVKDLPLFPDIR